MIPHTIKTAIPCPTALATALLLAVALFASTKAQAGWYQVTNYEGHIGAYPVRLSIQKYEGFGSGLNIRGSYYYDRYLHAIPLYGKLDEQGDLSLCEVHGDEEYTRNLVFGSPSPVDTTDCPFRLRLEQDSARGVWASGGRSHDVVLNEVGRLDNTDSLTVTGTLEIPFWGQTPGHLFLGAYSREGVAVKVVDKRTRRLVQSLWPQADGCVAFGFVMTPIYRNVERRDSDDRHWITFNCDGRGVDEVAYYRLNRDTGKFEYAPVDVPRVAYGDFDGDGLTDEARLTEHEDRVTLVIQRGGASEPEQLEFPIGSDVHNALCGLPVLLELSELSCGVDGAVLPGCLESRNAVGLSLRDNSCDAIHLYWNYDEERMSWWRR